MGDFNDRIERVLSSRVYRDALGRFVVIDFIPRITSLKM